MANFGVISIRKELACKQAHLATFLNISRQSLAHAEKNSRSLEMDQLNVIAKLHEQIAERKKSGWNSPEITKLLEKEKSLADAALADQLAETRHLWQKHRLELDKMIAEYNERSNALHQLHFMKSQDNVWTKSQLDWIDNTIALHKKKRMSCNPSLQRELEFQIVMLAAKIEALNKLIGNTFDVVMETLNFFDGMQSSTDGISGAQQ